MHRSLRQLRPLVPKAPVRLSPFSSVVRHNHQHAPSTSASSSATGPSPNLSSGEPQGTRTTHFGFKTVPEEQKEDLVRNVFESVASSYDVMNDAMSLGVHRLWKDEFVARLHPGARGAKRCIDVAGGTGDIALRILDYAREKHADRETSVDVVDINGEMLKEGFKRFKKTMYHNTPQIAFKQANAQAMPEEEFPSNTYDLYTIAFGIRNCTSVPDVLKEAYRVLKPGGTFACLEFSRVNNPLFGTLYDQYSFSVIPLLGTILAGDRESYQYLVESIRKFPPQPEFAKMIVDAGFTTGGMHEGKGGTWTDLWGGIASIHTGVKL
ncbi:2-methoxy-6-polyprenyl-1,4-benzoquinol methylase, mitochondrial [Trametes pubescens]|uniref:2-methoxy-6-polyprenyl-1,4-benzoquinol methylase, mitochondrial n=1 Tax=Trametes pubescens TaxID=154538 RepID=A0A1M2VYV7_TRAPU|nr:2-methoxy-6-polyprenyl-1,4-benzoquinol methylase, mitochondrial [Trametes pubescens]